MRQIILNKKYNESAIKFNGKDDIKNLKYFLKDTFIKFIRYVDECDSEDWKEYVVLKAYWYDDDEESAYTFTLRTHEYLILNGKTYIDVISEDTFDTITRSCNFEIKNIF